MLFKKKLVINFNVMIIFSKHSLKISPHFNFSSGFHTDFGGGMFTKLKQCKQTTGPKSVVLGAEMHRTRGKNPSYHVIIKHIYFINHKYQSRYPGSYLIVHNLK